MPLHQIAETCNSARLYADIADTWQDASGGNHGIKNIMDFWTKNPQFATLRNSLAPGTVYYNDPDQLMIGNRGLSHSQAEAQMGMWVMWAAPLILSTDLRNGSMSADAKAILLNKEVLEIADDELGLHATQCLDGCSHKGVLYGGATSVWNKTLSDGSVAVAMMNTGNFGYIGTAFGDYNISFTAKAVGLVCGDAPAPTPTPAPSGFTHTDNAFLEPVPADNILCDDTLSVDELKARCEATSDCASFAGKVGHGGCLKRCSENTRWVNGTGNDGWHRDNACGSSADKTRFEVRDLFRGKDLGAFTGSFWREVDESSLMLLRVRCADTVVSV